MRQVMEIKPTWLLEGMQRLTSEAYTLTLYFFPVAPHYFKPADLEQLASGEKKMPKTIGITNNASNS